MMTYLPRKKPNLLSLKANSEQAQQYSKKHHDDGLTVIIHPPFTLHNSTGVDQATTSQPIRRKDSASRRKNATTPYMSEGILKNPQLNSNVNLSFVNLYFYLTYGSGLESVENVG